MSSSASSANDPGQAAEAKVGDKRKADEDARIAALEPFVAKPSRTLAPLCSPSAVYTIIALEDGWQNMIRAKAIDPLEAMLEDLGTGMGKDKEKNGKKLFTNAEYSHIYSVCYNMCTQRSPYNWSEQLYNRHGESIIMYLSLTVLPKLKALRGEQLLRELSRRGKNHKIMNKWLRMFFMYLDRYYVKYHNLPSLEDSGCRFFKIIIFDALKQDVATALMDLVDKERDGGLIDRNLISRTVRMFETMGLGSLDVYIHDFESPYLKATRDYYSRKTEQWMQNDATPTYMSKIEACLREECARASRFLHPESLAKVTKVIEEEAIRKRTVQLLEKEGSGVCALLANEMHDDLARMYRLLSRVHDGSRPMGHILKAHVSNLCADVVSARVVRAEASPEKEAAHDPQFIKDLIEIHSKSFAIIKSHLNNDPLLQAAIHEAFDEALNRNVGKHKVATLLSAFCDGVLKTGSSERLSDADIENLLDSAIRLFLHLHDKDLFVHTYRQHLSRRLLNQRSTSDDNERSMIGKLKLRCGAQFTSKMEGMVNDLSVGTGHDGEFQKFLQGRGMNVDFSVQVLTNGFWPVVQSFDIHLPPLLQRCVKTFGEFYAATTSKRRLQWHFGLGSAVLKAAFGSRVYDLQVSTLQAVVLLQFNDARKKTVAFQTLSSQLGIPDEHLRRVLHSLSCCKYKILRRHQQQTEGAEDKASGSSSSSSSSSVKNSDSFSFNEAFSSQMKRIRIPVATLDDSFNPKQVEDERGYIVEAAIVRTMKARKVCAHLDLIAEVMAQLAFFRPENKVVKRRIELLIEREYLERDQTDKGMYRYLA